VKPALYILGIGLWTALLYFFADPLLAGIWCLVLIAFGLLVYIESQEVEIEQPKPPIDVVDLEQELNCRGRLPRDKDFEAVGSGRRAA
jgi:hypothetical protein